MEKTVERMWFNGKRHEPVGAQVVLYGNGVAVATVEQDKATRGQFIAALVRQFPAYCWRVEACGPNGCGYLLTSAEARHG